MTVCVECVCDFSGSKLPCVANCGSGEGIGWLRPGCCVVMLGYEKLEFLVNFAICR